jgi:uncharacterized membrane protein YfcA
MTFFVAFISSVFSGMAGGGGGFMIGPYWLLSGMSPAQGATTGAFLSIGSSLSSVAAFRGSDHLPTDKRLLIILSSVTTVAAIAGALVLPHINPSTYRITLALITLAALPLLFVKKSNLHAIKGARHIGLTLAVILLVLGSIIVSSAFSILFSLTLISFFNLSVMQTTALRRSIGVAQSVVLFIVLASQGYFVWTHAIMALLGASLGSYIGTKYAVKKGETFAKYALAISAVIGATALLL